MLTLSEPGYDQRQIRRLLERERRLQEVARLSSERLRSPAAREEARRIAEMSGRTAFTLGQMLPRRLRFPDGYAKALNRCWAVVAVGIAASPDVVALAFLRWRMRVQTCELRRASVTLEGLDHHLMIRGVLPRRAAALAKPIWSSS
ncbi:MAG: hypothetical protein R3B72_47995 [Polyangiaceae bacterium]